MNEFKFHLSLPTKGLGLTERFYTEKLGCITGRTGTNWIDLDLFGNQITFTSAGEYTINVKKYAFEDKILPAFHFGILLDSVTWESVYEKNKGADFMWMSPKTFLESKIGEHRSFFVEDPNGYIIEFKAFAKKEEIFKHV